jgi:hypothetical protein
VIEWLMKVEQFAEEMSSFGFFAAGKDVTIY